MSDQDGGEHSSTFGGTGLFRDTGGQEADHAPDGETPRWRTGGEDHCHATGPPPTGYAKWTLRFAGPQGGGTGDSRFGELPNRASYAKKNGMTNRTIQYWVIPPEADAEFVAHMEDVLERLLPYDPEGSGAVHGRATGAIGRRSQAADRGDARRSSQACGLRVRTCGHREHLHVCRTARRVATGFGPRRTKVDWAIEMADLLEGRYADAKR